MIRVMAWEAGALTPTTPVLEQVADHSPAMALVAGNTTLGIEDLIGGAFEMIYLGRLEGFEEFEDVVAMVDEDGIAKGLPVNVHATVLARYLGAHPRDIPHEGLHGTVVFANRTPGGGPLTNVHPTIVTLGLAGPERQEFRDGMNLPSNLAIPPGVVVDTPQLFQVNAKARRAGCDLLLPGWTAVMISGDKIFHTITNQGRTIRHTASGVAYLRCHAYLAIFVDQKPRAQPFSAWLDIPLQTYITLPVPAKWDPTHPDFTGGRVYSEHVTVGDLMGRD